MLFCFFVYFFSVPSRFERHYRCHTPLALLLPLRPLQLRLLELPPQIAMRDSYCYQIFYCYSYYHYHYNNYYYNKYYYYYKNCLAQALQRTPIARHTTRENMRDPSFSP